MSAASKIASLRYSRAVGEANDEGQFELFRQYRNILVEDRPSKETYRRYVKLLCQLLNCHSASLLFVSDPVPHEIAKHTVSGSTNNLCAAFFQSIQVGSGDLQIVNDVAAEFREGWNSWKHEAPNVLAFALITIRINDIRLCYLIVTDICQRVWTQEAIDNLRDVAQMLTTDLEVARERHLVRTQKIMQRSLVQFVRGNLHALGEASERPLNPNQTRSLYSDLDEDIEVDDAEQETEQIEVSSMNVMFDFAARLIRRTLQTSGCLMLNIENLSSLENIRAEFPSRSTIMGACFLRHLRTTSWHRASGTEPSTSESSIAPSASSEALSHKKVDRRDVFDPEGLGGPWLRDLLENHPRAVAFDHDSMPDEMRTLLPAGLQSCLVSPIYDSNAKAFALIIVFNDRKVEFSKIDCHYIEAFGSSIYAEVLNQSLQRANEAKALFISKISHEFRTPLHGVLASAEFLNDMPETSLAQRGFVQTIDSCGRTLLEIINHVLDYSKLSYSNNVLEKDATPETATIEQFNVIQVAEEILASAFSAYEFKKINDQIDVFKTNSSKSLSNSDSGSLAEGLGRNLEVIFMAKHLSEGYHVIADQGAYTRIILNLVGNALKYTHTGHVTILIELSPSAENPALRDLTISVADTGIGIEKSFLLDMFKPFSQEDQFSTGTGLGLSIVKELCTRLHGKIEVLTQKARGSTFKVSLPVIPALPSPRLFPGAGVRRDLYGVKFHYIYADEISEDQAENASTALLESSTVTILKEWYGMIESDWGEADILISDEMTYNQDLDLIQAFKGPILFLCSTTAKYERSLRKSAKVLHTFITKPCGPLKLGECLSHCISTAQTMSRMSDGSGISPSFCVPARPVTDYDERMQGPATNSSSSTVRAPREQNNVTGGYRRTIREESDAHSLSELVKLHESMQSSPSTTVATLAQDGLSPRSNHRSNNQINATSATSGLQEGNRPSPQGRMLPVEEGAKSSRKHMLIVEDNPINMMLLVTFGKQKGLSVTTAVNGALAVTRVADRPTNFDVVLMDLNMPVMNGFDATKAIRKFELDQGREPCKIVALTGLSTAEDKGVAKKAGVDEFFTKPVMMKALAELLMQWDILQTVDDSELMAAE